MKKLTLFVSIITAGILMTSCLGEVSNSYADSTFVYLDMSDNAVMYGKTVSPYSGMKIITHANMMAMSPGTIKVMSYSWDEDYGTTSLSISGETVDAHNVRLSDETLDIVITPLIMDIEAPEVEDPSKFVQFTDPLYGNSKDFMDDKWIFQYSYEAGKDQTAWIEFYKREGETITGNDITVGIDVNISLLGTAEGTAVEQKIGAIAVDMSMLREAYEVAGGSSTKNLRVDFYYHVKGLDGRQKSTQTYTLTIAG